MKRILFALGCTAVLLLQSSPVKTQEKSTPKPINHGGKIETRYDGFNYETVMRLKRMKINCDGFKDKFKDACVSIEVMLHLPGQQLNYVKQVTLQVVFENKDWVHFHGPDQRDMAMVTDTETLNLGRMSPVSTNTPGSWDTKVETLEIKIPYKMFKKIAHSQSIELQVGRSAVGFRDKNLMALRDLDSRVISPESAASK
jgi:hypothetical protein